MSNNSNKRIKRHLDKLWQQAIRNRDQYCQVCGNTEGLNGHHIFSRSRMNTRWDIENGILLCTGCHTFSSLMSAHKASRAFFEWLERTKGKTWVDNLEARSQMICKGIDYMAIEIYLNEEIITYEHTRNSDNN